MSGEVEEVEEGGVKVGNEDDPARMSFDGESGDETEDEGRNLRWT